MLLAAESVADPRPGLRAPPAAPRGAATPVHHRPRALRHLRAVRPGLRVPRRPPRTGALAAGVVPPDGRPPLDGVRRAADRLPRGARAEFLRRPRAHYRRYRTPGAAVAAAAPGCGTLLVRTGRATARTGRCGSRSRCGSAPSPRRVGPRPGACVRPRCGRTTGVQRRLPVRADRAVFAGLLAAAATAATRPPWRPRSATFAPRHAHGVGRPPRAPAHAADRRPRRLRPGTAAYWTALARSKYLVNNVNFDRRLRQAARPGPRPDPARHPAEAHGPRPAGPPGRRPRHRLRRQLLRGRRHVGLLPVRQPPLHPGLGARLPRRLHHPGVRATRATTSSSGPPSADVARLRESLGIPRGHGRGAVRAHPPRLPARAQRLSLDLERVLRAARPALRAAGPRPPRLRRLRRRRTRERPGSSTSPATRASRSCASPPTRWSPTTRR